MRDVTWLTYIMLVLASYRFTHLIVFDKITEFLRKPFVKKVRTINETGHSSTKKVIPSMFGYLVNCYWCAGIWSSLFIGVGYLYFSKMAMPIIFIFSIAGAAAIIETFVGVGSKWIAYLSARTNSNQN